MARASIFNPLANTAELPPMSATKKLFKGDIRGWTRIWAWKGGDETREVERHGKVFGGGSYSSECYAEQDEVSVRYWRCETKLGDWGELVRRIESVLGRLGVGETTRECVFWTVSAEKDGVGESTLSLGVEVKRVI